MFDPFGDFETAGYLRNVDAEKNMDVVKAAEHALFRLQLPLALDFLAQCRRIRYADFLEVHRILFDGLYPWAGRDRAELTPDKAVMKGDVYFCHPRDCRRAIDEGLSLAQERRRMSEQPGLIMGLFAMDIRFSTAMAARCCWCTPSFAVAPASRSTGPAPASKTTSMH